MTAPVSQEHVLLVEDDEVIGRSLVSGLRAHGYAIGWQRTGAGALIEASARNYDVVLLDLGLPDLDGVDVARDLRQQHPDLVIVILTARGDDIDVVVGLDMGANDYVVKPVGLTVLLARLRAHLRVRRQDAPFGDSNDSQRGVDASMIAVGDLTIDLAARRCHLAGVEMLLRPKEFDLLHELAAHAGTALRRQDLMAAVWDEHWTGSTKTLDVTMVSLRRAIDETAATVELPGDRTPQITTLRGHGYRFEASSQADGSSANG